MLAPEIIRRVREIQIRIGRRVADVLAGEYVSVFKGTGIEFDEVRPYLPGDDVRTIDWNVTARAGAPYVKRYIEERQLNLMLMADVSGSQGFGSGARSKRECAADLCALLAFAAIHNDDKVGLVLFHHDVEQYIPPRKGQKHALRVVREVLAHEGSEPPPAPVPFSARLRRRLPWGRTHRERRTVSRRGTDIGAALEFLLSVTKRRSVCFLISDFLDTGYERALSMTNRRHDVVAVLITDPREHEIPDIGLVDLEDAESGEVALVDTGSPAFRTYLADAANTRVRALEEEMRRRGVDFIHVDAAGDPVEPLVRFFRMRERRDRR